MAWLGRFDDFNEAHEIVANCMTNQQHNVFRANDKSRNANEFEYKQKVYCPISSICNGMQAISTIGIIIAKDGPKSIICKKGGNERHLMTLTLRDTPDAFINVTCWGAQEYIQSLSSELSIGTVVEIKSASVQAKSHNAADDKFKPWTPSPCQLNLSDNQGTILPCNDQIASEYLNLLHIPTKANNDFYTLQDVQVNGTNLQGEHVNILAAVKKIWPVREISTKSGKSTVKQDIILCDETCQSFSLTLWGSCVDYATQWVPMKTVIFASDVRITFNEFRSTMVASTDSKTIITSCPEIPEAHSLFDFMKTQFSFFSTDGGMDIPAINNDPDIQAITKVLTVKQLRTLQGKMTEDCTEYAVTYAFLSLFDIDGDDKSILQSICSKCKKPVQEETNFICLNHDCNGSDPKLFGNSTVHIDYRMSVHLTDHTGTLEYCHVSSLNVEQLLGYKPTDFQNLTYSQKTCLKWNYLFERVKAVMKIRKLNRGFYLQILDLSKVEPNQLLEHGFTDV